MVSSNCPLYDTPGVSRWAFRHDSNRQLKLIADKRLDCFFLFLVGMTMSWLWSFALIKTSNQRRLNFPSLRSLKAMPTTHLITHLIKLSILFQCAPTTVLEVALFANCYFTIHYSIKIRPRYGTANGWEILSAFSETKALLLKQKKRLNRKADWIGMKSCAEKLFFV